MNDEESIPIQDGPPKPLAAPRRPNHRDNSLAVTPQRRTRPRHDRLLLDDHSKDGGRTIQPKVPLIKANATTECILAEPGINSTAALSVQLERLTTTDGSNDGLKSNIDQAVINERCSTALNFKLHETRYKDLVPIYVNKENDLQSHVIAKKKTKARKSGTEPIGKHIMDLWDPGLISEEISFSVDLGPEMASTSDSTVTQFNEDSHSYLLDLYLYKHCGDIVE